MKQTVEQALRLIVKLRVQQEVGDAFSKYRWQRQSCPWPQGARGGVIVVDSSIWIDFLNGCAACPATPRAPWHGRDRRGDLMLCKVLQGLDRSVLRSTSGRCSKTPIFPANSKRFAPSSPSRKNNSLRDHPNSALESRRLIPHEGRIAIVTDAGWDAVDAAASGVKRVRRAVLP